jgi:cell division protein FtsB
MKKKRFARWSLIFAANGAVLLVVGVSTIRETYREWKVDQEVHSMQSQIEQLEGRKLSLMDLVQRMESPDALDREARTRLGLRKPGERVIILRGVDGEADSWEEWGLDPEEQAVAPEPKTNPERWARYFFVKK